MRSMFAIALLLLAAAPPSALRPGLWQVESVPTGASLDGRPLGDLPYTPPTAPTRICVSPEQARGGAFLARDLPEGCSVTRSTLTGGRVTITATCPPQAPGLARGDVQVTGRWTATSYAMTFNTHNPSENGVMGFSGRMTGRRVGDCPAVSAPPARPS